MKCPICDGGGRITSLPSGMPVKCTRCNGTGEVEQTNEEWRKNCSAEEFVEWITNTFCCCDNHPRLKEAVKRDWMKWLKQPHGKIVK